MNVAILSKIYRNATTTERLLQSKAKVRDFTLSSEKEVDHENEHLPIKKETLERTFS